LFPSSSNPPKRAKLSKNLVALLSYGGVPNDFFLDILLNTLEKKKTIFFKVRAAGKGMVKTLKLSSSFAIRGKPWSFAIFEL